MEKIHPIETALGYFRDEKVIPTREDGWLASLISFLPFLYRDEQGQLQHNSSSKLNSLIHFDKKSQSFIVRTYKPRRTKVRIRSTKIPVSKSQTTNVSAYN